MQNNQTLENSSKLYALLLNLYPREHREEYGVPMQQVFQDQCRSAAKQKGPLGVLLLWLRTMLDLVYTAFLEHVTSPRATWGLMEPVPNQPLPWKGVFLILLPGLVYLVGQIAQMTGEVWYMVIYYRAGFFLMIPPLLVWVIKRRYPIWGLMPIGLFFHLAKEMSVQWLGAEYSIVTYNSYTSSTSLKNSNFFQDNALLLTILLMTVVLAILAWRYFHQIQASRNFWIWLGVFILFSLTGLVNNNQEYFASFPRLLISMNMREMLKFSLSWQLFDIIADLLLVFIGTLFISRHGFFTVLILLGYFLPRILLGYNSGYWPEGYPTLFDTLALLIIGYRALLALVAPVWIARSKTPAGQKTAFWVSFGLVFGIATFMKLGLWQFSIEDLWLYGANWLVSDIRDQLAFFSLIALAASIYHNIPERPTQPDEQSYTGKVAAPTKSGI